VTSKIDARAGQTAQPPLSRQPDARSRSGCRHVIVLASGAGGRGERRTRATAEQFRAAGWDVTALTVGEGSGWQPPDTVGGRFECVELPLRRDDEQTDIRAFSERRARDPNRWLRGFRRRTATAFPEPVFGAWRGALEDALREAHQVRPADLVVAGPPYVTLAAAWRLWRDHDVPYAVDLRAGWSFQAATGHGAFNRRSAEGDWESRVLADARAIWCETDLAVEFYRRRYPEIAPRFRTVRNGYDAASLPRDFRSPDPEAGLTFGYLGSLNLPLDELRTVIAGWRLARHVDPVIARSRLEVRGGGPDDGYAACLAAAGAHGVVHRGAVPKDQVAAVYEAWDAVVLLLAGGRGLVPGTAYEALATGLPVVAAFARDHEASDLVAGHPLGVRPARFEPDDVARALAGAAALACKASADDRTAARAYAAEYERGSQLATAVHHLTGLLQPTAAGVE
jgi:glycosyltransferase involved in cell wall biosynthesis